MGLTAINANTTQRMAWDEWAWRIVRWLIIPVVILWQ